MHLPDEKHSHKDNPHTAHTHTSTHTHKHTPTHPHSHVCYHCQRVTALSHPGHQQKTWSPWRESSAAVVWSHLHIEVMNLYLKCQRLNTQISQCKEQIRPSTCLHLALNISLLFTVWPVVSAVEGSEGMSSVWVCEEVWPKNKQRS